MNEQKVVISKPVLSLVGQTAVGKTSLSIEIAKLFDCEIVSTDSMQIYRYMDIGTAKVSKDEQARIPHHLVDIIDPDETYNASRFVDDALAAIAAIHQRDKIPLLTGGTGLYLKALTQGLFENAPGNQNIKNELHVRLKRDGLESLYNELVISDPDYSRKIHQNDTARIIRGLEIIQTTGKTVTTHLKEQAAQENNRIFLKFLCLGIEMDRQKLYQRIDLRTELMLEQGFEEEVQWLLDNDYPCELKSMKSIGYKQMCQYLGGQISYPKLKETIARDTRHYAKRQMTWFRKEKSIEWVSHSEPETFFHRISSWLEAE